MKRDPSLVRLSRDHHRGLVVALRVQKEAPNATPGQLAELGEAVLSFWQTALLPHFRAECECLLTRLARSLGLQDELIVRTQADHLKLNSLFIQLQDGADNEQSRTVLTQMAVLLQDHIRWEEAMLFDRTQQVLSQHELGVLGADIALRIPEVPAPPPLTLKQTERA